MTDIKTVAAFFSENDNFLILSHASPDGDTVGSAYGLCHALHKMGKKARVECADEIPARYDYMVKPVEIQDFQHENIVAVDVADLKLLGKNNELYGDKIALAIDHHRSNKGYAPITYVNADAGANCENIYALILELGVEIDKVIADNLYTGIVTDTGCFKYQNTTANTHIIASKLIECGADYYEINRIMFDTKSFARLKVEQQAVDNIEMHFDNRCALMTITAEMQSMVTPDELEGVTPIPRQIEGVVIGVTIREKTAGKFKCSVRTHEPIDASEICAMLGGGGHNRAAGCEILGTLDEAKQKMLKSISDYLGE